MGRPARTRRPVNGTVLAARRAELELTRVQVSERAADAGYSLDDSNLAKLENGKTRYPSLETRLALTAVLGLTDDEMHAPCKRYGHQWSAGCRNHGGRGGQRRGEAQTRAAASGSDPARPDIAA